MRVGLTKPCLLIIGSRDVAKAESGTFEQRLTINVAGMSWPVRYGAVRTNVATLAQEFLEGLSPPTSEMMFKPCLSNVVMTTDLFAGL